jgi:hypothetical protein
MELDKDVFTGMSLARMANRSYRNAQLCLGIIYAHHDAPTDTEGDKASEAMEGRPTDYGTGTCPSWPGLTGTGSYDWKKETALSVHRPA